MNAVIGLTACTCVLAMYIVVMGNISQQEHGYNQGWADHEELMRLYDMTPDDEALLKELKDAVRLYIKQTGLYRRGDMSTIDSATDFKEFRDIAWELTVKRKERK